MNFTASNFITIPRNSSINQYRTGRNTFEYSDNGIIVYPIGMVPVIEKGRGCIGIATVTSFTVGQELTNVKFKYREFQNNPRDKALAEAFYSMYRNNLETSDASEYGAEDVFIPGAMATPITSRKHQSNNSYLKSEDDGEESVDEEMNRIMRHLHGDDGNPSF